MSDTISPTANTAPAKRSTGLLLGTLLIIMALTAGLAWQYWQQQQQQLEQKQQQQQWHAQLNQLQQQLHTLSLQLNSQAQHRALLAAKHTLQLADYQRHYHHDAKATIALLQLAAQQSNPTTYPTLQSVHNALQRDIATMQSHANQDPSTWLIQLDALKQSIPQLQQIPSKITASTQSTDDPPSTDPQPKQKLWQKLWQRSKQIFSTMVVVRHVAQPITPLLGTTDLVTLQDNLALTLSQAQWAIMNHQAKLYQQSLHAATQMLSYFAGNDPQTEHFSQQLAKLSQAPIEASLPKLDSSFSAIDLALNHYLAPAVTSTAAQPAPDSSHQQSASTQTNAAES